ncbi:putative amidase [Ascoidea rubescens DSM 1968]|uniref:amidase n=1 Tax=Ascoidea rubescens DSM 1968 TaxID=1344418 RepID=A0A1D2VF54_9ASCO|nr:amidase [Ascoidea rubescens DSM 1968]ODV60304.1 amidase [Ascoidea rubescens DSM 1968]
MTVIDPQDYYKFEYLDDQDKYEKIYKPKIEKYNQAIQNDMKRIDVDISKLPPPELLDSTNFNSLKFLEESNLLSEKELKLTNLPAYKIVELIADGELTSTEITKAYLKRCVIGNYLLNYACDFLIDQALETAKELDEYYLKTGKTVGPLHGLPMSVKEHYGYKDRITHAGFVSLIDNIAPADQKTTSLSKKAGAVFIVRTAQPQSIMHLDTINNITGRTRNVYNTSLSPGGSSGGEGACVSFSGSALGLGSDIGGSIRTPAAFNGIYGLRPTSLRVSLAGSISGGAGQESVMGVVGPIAKTAEDLDLYMSAYFDQEPWEVDSLLVPLPWKKVGVPNPKDLKIGIIYDDGIVKPLPPVIRGLDFISKKLKESGVNVVKFVPPKTQEAYDTVHHMYTCDGNYMHKKMLSESGEPLLPLTKWFLSFGKGDEALSVKENRELNGTRNKLRQEYTDLLNDLDIDFVISPSYVNSVPKPNQVYYWGYTSLWNILDFPTTVFPTGLFQDPELDIVKKEDYDYQPRSHLEQLEHETYGNPRDFEGSPISLQLSGRRYRDEEVVAATKLISKILE